MGDADVGDVGVGGVDVGGCRMEASIQKYEAFLESYRQGSFTRAAASLSYSQSGVSRMVADLERDWQLTLLERGRGPLRLTSDGRRLLPLVQEVCESNRRLRMEIDDLRGVQSGSIRIGTFSSVATHWLPPVISRFQTDYPNIDYELLMGDFGEIGRWCEEGRVDLGFLPFAPSSSTLVAQALGDDELLAVLPKGHVLAQGRGVAVEQLCEEPFIMLQKSGDNEVSAIFERAGLTPQVRFRTFDDYAIMSMVESGLGLSILPELILRRNPYDIEVCHLEPRAFRTIRVVTREPGRLPIAARRFLSYLRFR